jgi:hypothetical protein
VSAAAGAAERLSVITVIPAKAGIRAPARFPWIPAFAGDDGLAGGEPFAGKIGDFVAPPLRPQEALEGAGVPRYRSP